MAQIRMAHREKKTAVYKIEINLISVIVRSYLVLFSLIGYPLYIGKMGLFRTLFGETQAKMYRLDP